ncbi:50S ribosomal protein L24 [Gammaproteobacteria bacterium AH-315-C21]|nr:50S ribosomal protein L24 [Gammaproteobacteria bacterium AH-315-C21]
MRKIKKGDDVIVLTGKDKGKQGTVNRVMPDEDRVVIGGINMVKRHTKSNPNAGVAGGIIDKEMPIHVSNIAIFNPITKKGDRVGIKTLEDGKKVRYFKSNDEVVDV